MAATRTQIYLTAEQREVLDRIADGGGQTLAAVIREAVDDYIVKAAKPDVHAILKATFGSMPDLKVPSRDEWDRGYG